MTLIEQVTMCHAARQAHADAFADMEVTVGCEGLEALGEQLAE